MSRAARHQRGVTLVELVLVIVIGGVVLASIAGALAWAAARSGNDWPLKQASVVAESLMGEIALRPVTGCDADGPAPSGSTVCVIADAGGPETGESRYSSSSPFDHPNDYHGFSMSGIRALDGTAIAGLEDYGATVTVQPQTLDGVPLDRGLWVTVTATGPNGSQIRLQAFQARVGP